MRRNPAAPLRPPDQCGRPTGALPWSSQLTGWIPSVVQVAGRCVGTAAILYAAKRALLSATWRAAATRGVGPCYARLGGQTPAPGRRRAFITLQGMRPDSSLPCIALVVARYRTCWTDSTGKKKTEAGAPFPRAPSQVAGARGEWRAG